MADGRSKQGLKKTNVARRNKRLAEAPMPPLPLDVLAQGHSKRSPQSKPSGARVAIDRDVSETVPGRRPARRDGALESNGDASSHRIGLRNLFARRILQSVGPPEEKGILTHSHVSTFYCGTSIGNKRTRNEDRSVCVYGWSKALSRPLLVAGVADGVGGLAQGDRCASLALADILSEAFWGQPYRGKLGAWLEAVLHGTNSRVFAEFSGNSGTTVALFGATPSETAVSWLGDSRVIAITGDMSRQLTRDDKAPEAARNEISAFVGMEESASPHSAESVISRSESADWILVASDGISMIHSSTLASILNNPARIDNPADRLLTVADIVDGSDNSTIVLVAADRIGHVLSSVNDKTLFAVFPDGALQLMYGVPTSDYAQQPKTQDVGALSQLLGGKWE